MDATGPVLVGLPWSVVGSGDFNGDGKADILWHSGETNETQIWFMNGDQNLHRAPVEDEQGAPIYVGLPWSVVGVGDFNGDGKADILWHSGETNETQIWFMNGDHQIVRRAPVEDEQGVPVTVGLPWSIVGAGDQSGDGKADIVWHSGESNETQIWFMNGDHQIVRRAPVEATGPALVGLPWSVVGSGDFNGDGKADILWHSSQTNETQIWFMNGDQLNVRRAPVEDEHGAPVTVGLPWSIVGVGDQNADGKADIIWHSSQTNETQIWFMNGDHQIVRRTPVEDEHGAPIYVGSPWSIVGVGDLNRDGKGDILWHNSDNNYSQIWFMNGDHGIAGRATVVDEGGVPFPVGLPWSIAGVGDFNRDGKGDILWHNSDNNYSQIWFMNGDHGIAGRATVADESGASLPVGLPWSIVGVGDQDGDGKADIVWHSGETNETQIWFMNGDHQIVRRAPVEATGPALVGLPWSVVGSGDFNGDGKADILWHSSQTNETQIWFMNGDQLNVRRAPVEDEHGGPIYIGLPWSIVGVGDQNADGKADIVWHNGDSNETQIWFMNGDHQISSRSDVVNDPISCAGPNPSPLPSAVPGDVQMWHGLSSAQDGTGTLATHTLSGHDQSLAHSSETFGVDLDFQDGPASWTVEGWQGSGPQLVKGQAVALHVSGGGWLKLQDQTFGIGLGFDEFPSCQWVVLGGTLGEPLNAGTFALWNTVRRDFLIYHDSVATVDLYWRSEIQDPLPTPDPGPVAQPAAAQSGVGLLRVFNCVAAQHPVSVWVKDTTAGGGFQKVGGLAYQSDAQTGCVAKDSQPLTFTPVAGHSDQVVVTDPMRTGCGADDPLNTSCVVETRTIVGNPAGAIETTTVGVGTERSPYAFNALNQ